MSGSFAARSSPHAPELLAHAEDRYGFWLWRNIGINVWLAPADGQVVEQLSRVSLDYTARHPEGMSAIHWVLGGAGLPTSDGREALNRLAERNDVACVGVVLGGAGFWASAVRSLVTGIRLASGGRFALRMSPSIDELGSWFPQQHAAKTGVELARAELVRAVSYARDHTPRRRVDVGAGIGG